MIIQPYVWCKQWGYVISVAHQYLVAVVIGAIQDKGVEGVNNVAEKLTGYEDQKVETGQYVGLAREKRSKQRVPTALSLIIE